MTRDDWYEVPNPGTHVPSAWVGRYRLRADPELSLILTRTASCGWHMSIARPDRLPSWEEVRDTRYAFIPDQHQMAMILPPQDEYVNLHDFCFQLIEVQSETRLFGNRYTALEGSHETPTDR